MRELLLLEKNIPQPAYHRETLIQSEAPLPVHPIIFGNIDASTIHTTSLTDIPPCETSSGSVPPLPPSGFYISSGGVWGSFSPKNCCFPPKFPTNTLHNLLINLPYLGQGHISAPDFRLYGKVNSNFSENCSCVHGDLCSVKNSSCVYGHYVHAGLWSLITSLYNYGHSFNSLRNTSFHIHGFSNFSMTTRQQ